MRRNPVGEMFDFMAGSPFLTFFLVLVCGEVVTRVAIGLPNRILRHMNIRKHGYPPPHCDADGDFREHDDA
jgi:hypothetical protein